MREDNSGIETRNCGKKKRRKLEKLRIEDVDERMGNRAEVGRQIIRQERANENGDDDERGAEE
jgi:hypothetical protein